MTTDPTDDLNLDAADAQDLTDLISGLTAIGGYAAQAGLGDDASRIASLRRRLIIENRELAETLLAADPVTTGADAESFKTGIQDILDEADGGEGGDTDQTRGGE